MIIWKKRKNTILLRTAILPYSRVKMYFLYTFTRNCSKKLDICLSLCYNLITINPMFNKHGGGCLEKRCAVLFSGGLDSSLVVCKMIENGYNVELLHFNQGTLISNNLTSIRYCELKRVYNDGVQNLNHVHIEGLFRRIALVSLEQDIKKYGVSLVCLGCKLSMHIQSIIYCTKNRINTLADGSTKKQSKYGEQREVSLGFIKDVYGEYGISYINPIFNLEKKDIKYSLFDRGITIQPMEDTCMFSNTFSFAPDEILLDYLESKKNLCVELIERGLSYEKNR